MWDIGGQESLRSVWNTYYTSTEFLIVVVDSTDRERLSITKEELYRMLDHEVGVIFNVCLCVYSCVQVCVCVYTCVCMYVFVCTHVCMCVV